MLIPHSHSSWVHIVIVAAAVALSWCRCQLLPLLPHWSSRAPEISFLCHPSTSLWNLFSIIVFNFFKAWEFTNVLVRIICIYISAYSFEHFTFVRHFSMNILLLFDKHIWTFCIYPASTIGLVCLASLIAIFICIWSVKHSERRKNTNASRFLFIFQLNL